MQQQEKELTANRKSPYHGHHDINRRSVFSLRRYLYIIIFLRCHYFLFFTLAVDIKHQQLFAFAGSCRYVVFISRYCPTDLIKFIYDS